MNTPETLTQYSFSLAELGSIVTSSISESVAAAEFRALSYVELDNWNIEDLKAVLLPKSLDVNEIEWIDIKRSLNEINFKKNVYIALNESCAWVFSYNENTMKLDGKCTQENLEQTFSDLTQFFDDSYNEWTFLKCQKQNSDNLAFIPGVEKHWFCNAFDVIRNVYFVSGPGVMPTAHHYKIL